MSPPTEAAIRAALRTGYDVTVDRLELELAGADVNAWTWRVAAEDRRRLFLKIRRGIRPAAVLVPRHLRSIGFEEVVAPLSTIGGEAWLTIDGWTAIVMDFIEGTSGEGTHLDLAGWRQLGAFAARLHAVELPPALRGQVPVETYSAAPVELARSLGVRIEALRPGNLDEHGRAVCARWLAERDVIARIVDLADELGRRIRAWPTVPRTVLCHADFHGANRIVDEGGGLHVIDWDEVRLAPPERDLVFIRGSVIAGAVSDVQADAFEAGYGPVAVDRELLAWYRIDWAVQDVTSWASEVLFEPDRVPPSRPRARRIFEGLFAPGGEVDGALAIADQVRP